MHHVRQRAARVSLAAMLVASVGASMTGCSSEPTTSTVRGVGGASAYSFVPTKLSDWSTCEDLGGAVLGTVTGVKTSVEDGWLVESVLDVRIDATNNKEHYGTDSLKVGVSGGRTAASNITIEPKDGDEAVPASPGEVVDEDWDGAPFPQVGERYVFFLAKDLHKDAYDVVSGPLGAYKMKDSTSVIDLDGPDTALDIASPEKFASPLHHVTLGQINDVLASTPAGRLRPASS